MAATAQAQPRVSTLNLSCRQGRAVVMSQGAVVLSTGPNTYDRFVSSPAFCAPGETTELVWVRTADTAQCPIGYRCRSTARTRTVEEEGSWPLRRPENDVSLMPLEAGASALIRANAATT